MATGSTIIDAILNVWSTILAWFGNAFDDLVPIFYVAETGLTFIGYLAVGGMAVSAAFLFLGMVQKWLRFGR